MIQIKRALISVSDKTGVVEFAKALCGLGVELLSTGGTLTALRAAGLEAIAVEDFTGFPEMLEGRVKTLHPRIHAGILADRKKSAHMQTLAAHDLSPIDLVCVNLYPFARAIKERPDDLEHAIENIDIGGPTLLRAAAKNYTGVLAVSNPRRYDEVLNRLRQGNLNPEFSLELATEVFSHTAAYDSMIARYLQERKGDRFPEILTISLAKKQDLRYGENPHQKAAFYHQSRDAGGVEQLQGKELSFNNMLDFSAAFRAALALPKKGAVIVKHLNPCGAACADSDAQLLNAFIQARACDPVSAFGGVIAINGEVSRDLALSITENFVEGVIAPAFSSDALEAFQAKPAVRLLLASPSAIQSVSQAALELRQIFNGVLVQDLDPPSSGKDDWKVVSSRSPSPSELDAMEFAWKLVKYVKSNAIVFCNSRSSLGIGAGQMSRVDSTEIAVRKARSAGLELKGSAVASDAFFPFRDGLDLLAQAGATAVIQPGGSIRDAEVIGACNEHNIAMVFTGMRHFLH